MGAERRPNRRQVLAGSAALALTPSVVRAQVVRPLKIGVLNDMSSLYADYQGIGSVVAAQLAVDDFSKALGVPVEIISADHQNKPDVGAAIARRWFDSDHVDVIMDLPNSAVALAVVAVAQEKNKAVIGSGAGSSVMTGAADSPSTSTKSGSRTRTALRTASTGPMTPTRSGLASARR